MSLRTDVYYRELAEQTLRAAGMSEPPISLDELAAHLGVPVLRGAYPSFFTGAIVSEHGMPVIMLNGSRNDVSQRQALAHMIGHLLIATDQPDEAFPRDGRPEHREAQVLGDELMLPAFMVLDQSRKWFNDYRYLARLFGVSEHDMLGRMKSMGLVKDRGIYWDY